jgi:hypothetical protein
VSLAGLSSGCATAIALDVSLPDEKATYTVTTDPAMPQVAAQARVAGVTPDPTATTSIHWTADLRFDATECPDGIAARSHHITLTHTAAGGQYTPAFNELRGGSLTFTAVAARDAQRRPYQSRAVQILGTNPNRSAIQAALPHDTLRRIACQESEQRQFAADANGGVSACPLFSSDGLGGVGIMQLTNPAPTAEEIWSWRANVAGGVTLFNSKIADARSFPAQVRTSQGYRTLLNHLNTVRAQQNLPPLQVALPDYTSGDFDANLQQLELDSLRGYNGYPAGGQFGLRMHEFQVVTDAVTGAIALDADGNALWERVPVAARPHLNDPDYVNRILARDPRCGG